MKSRAWFVVALAGWGFTMSNGLLAEEPAIQRFTAPNAPADWPQTAVVVKNAALAHTAQLFATDENGEIVGEANVARQLDQALANIEQAVRLVGGSRESIVKLNVYAATPETAQALPELLAQAFPAESRPAISLVVTPLPPRSALLALDAVAVADVPAPEDKSQPGAKGGHPSTVSRRRATTFGASERAGVVALLPRGDALYVSGQAEPGDTIQAAAQATFAGLLRTLEHYKLQPRDIAHFKVFLDPMEKADEVTRALEELLPEGTLPPVVYVQWEAPGSVEIEMIASAASLPASSGGDVASYLTPPWMSESPNFCRVVRVHGDRIVYFPGIYATEPGDGAAQVKSLFAQLGALAKQTGTNYEHLVKATYYVADDDSSAQLNKLRPDYYNPQRPPAASKASVKNVGRAGRAITMDMIGVVPRK